MNVIFLGEDIFSSIVLESLINAKHNIQLVISPIYNNNNHLNLKHITTKYKIPFHRIKNINSEEQFQQIKNLSPDLIITAHFSKLLNKDLMSLPKFGCINLHPSLLPAYRGLSPQHWPIINGESQTGITVHFIDEGIDTGAIILQEPVAISEEMYVSDLLTKWKSIYPFIMIKAIKMIEEGTHVFTPKKSAIESYYGVLKPENVIITEDMSTIAAWRLIKGVSFPYMGARYNNMVIYQATPILNTRNTTYPIGIYEKQNHLFLNLKDGILKIEKYIKQNNVN